MQRITHFGIDVSHKKLDISYQKSDGYDHQTIPNTNEAINKWITKLPVNAYCIFEATGSYCHKLEYHLGQSQIPYVKVNPNRIKGYVHALGALNKSDRQDSIFICQYGQNIKTTPNRPMTADNLEKNCCISTLASLKNEIQRIDNQIHAISQEPVAMTVVLSALEHVRASIEEQITHLQLRIDVLDEPTEKQISELIQTIPGIGKQSAVAITNAIGSFDHFDSDKQLAKFLGTAPVNASSGTSVRIRYGICRTAVPQVRACLYMAATSAIKANPACKELYLRLRSKGKPPKVARIAVVHKLIRQVFAVAKSGKPFDPDFEQNRSNSSVSP